MKKIHKFFSKDLLHILGAVGIFVAFLISIAYKQVGIGALIAAWLIAMAIIGVWPQCRPALLLQICGRQRESVYHLLDDPDRSLHSGCCGIPLRV